MKLSIVVPAKNEESIIDDFFDAILQQDELPEELIVVDNNSRDRTYQMIFDRVEQFAKRGVQLIPMECLHGNQIEARQMGFGTAKYDLIATLDMDSRPIAGWVRKVKEVFEEDPTLVGAGGRLIYNHRLPHFIHGIVFVYYRLNPDKYYFYGSNGIFRRSAYQASSGLDGNRMIMEKFHLQEPYDDLFLSYVLKIQGEVRPMTGIDVVVLSRRGGAHVGWFQAGKRLIGQFREILFLQKYLRTRFGRATISRHE